MERVNNIRGIFFTPSMRSKTATFFEIPDMCKDYHLLCDKAVVQNVKRNENELSNCRNNAGAVNISYYGQKTASAACISLLGNFSRR